MKIKVNTKDLKKAVSTASNFINKDSYRYVYTKLKFEYLDKKLKISAYSEQSAATICIAAEEIDAGTTYSKGLVDPDLCKSILSISDESTEIEFSEKNITIESFSSFTLQSSKELEDVVELIPLDGDFIKVEKVHLTALSNSEPFISDVFNSSAQMSGTRIHIDNKKMSITSTDSNSLLHNEFEIDTTNSIDCIIPKIGLSLINQIDNISELRVSENRIQWSGSDTIIQYLLLEGQFPPVDRLLSSLTEDFKFIISKPKLEIAIKSALILAEDSFIASFSIKDSEMIVEMKKAGRGKNRTKIEIGEFNGEVKINLNAKKLLDYLKITKSEELEFHVMGSLSNGSRPILILDSDQTRKFLIVSEIL